MFSEYGPWCMKVKRPVYNALYRYRFMKIYGLVYNALHRSRLIENICSRLKRDIQVPIHEIYALAYNALTGTV